MKILFAADGSKHTKKALGFLVTHEALTSDDAEVVVVNVQAPVPTRVKAMLGASAVASYHEDEARKVLAPIQKFLSRKGVPTRVHWCTGKPGQEIVRVAKKEGADMIVMGTHGHGILGRAVMGSVATDVVHYAEIPVLLVK